MSKTYNIGASHDGGEEIIFHLRGISVAEETRYTNQYAEISDLDSDEKKAEKEYAILTDSLATWSEKAPTVKQNGVESGPTVVEKPLTPGDAVRLYFADRTPEKERTAQQVVLQYRRKLQPRVVFY